MYTQAQQYQFNVMCLNKCSHHMPSKWVIQWFNGLIINVRFQNSWPGNWPLAISLNEMVVLLLCGHFLCDSLYVLYTKNRQLNNQTINEKKKTRKRKIHGATEERLSILEENKAHSMEPNGNEWKWMSV